MVDEELGFLAISKGNYQEAINIFKRVIEKKKTAKGFFGFGVAQYNLEDYLTARWAFYKVLELEPNNKEAVSYISNIEKNEKKLPAPKRLSLFRASDNYLEVYNKSWSKLFIKGINLGLGLPGYFPGDFSIKKGTYMKWFEMIAELGVNTVRIYAVHPPSFYEALYQFNESGKRLYLLQGIWTELPEDNNFNGREYVAYVRRDIKDAIDVLYGNIELPQRPGYAHGRYEYDVSPYTIGFIFGRESESCAVKKFNELQGRKLRDYKGRFLSIHDGTPFEVWITEMCDFLQDYEYERYKASHPVSVTNWPTLDPLEHPSESTYEEGLRFQGIKVRTDICNENEDMESLDVTKIKTKKGGGFFATYHAYPYYPDFMNNDYLNEKDTYLAYLKALKKYHSNQPVLIAEFGVPSSREITHWHRDGWHHGGHNEVKQGEINGILMKSIYEAGMAGGIVFGWFDEWFKRNWLFLPYEKPAERNPLWYNIQDAEQNYGLLAAYPGYPKRKVNLSGYKEDWMDAQILYEKIRNSMIFRFNDGFDEARDLRRLLAQHDEGFLYLLIETKGNIDFKKANYIIGLNTYSLEAGEFLFPLNINLLSPIGLNFLIHIAGIEKSRILTCQSYDKYLNTGQGRIRPQISDQGVWVIMQNKTNERRISKDGKKFYHSHVFSMSNLRFGSLNSKNPYYDSLADFFFIDNKIEIRIPWGLINITDPSSKMVLWMDRDGRIKKTEGIKIIVISYKPEEDHIFAKNTGLKNNITDCLPEGLKPESIKTYSWTEWDVPIYHTYLKESYYRYRDVLSKIPEAV